MGCSNGTAATTTEEIRIREKECSVDDASAASTASTLNCRSEGSVKKKSGHSFNKMRKLNPATEDVLKRLVSPEIDEALFNLNGLEKPIGVEGAKPMPPDRKLHDLHVKKLETYMKEVELLPRTLLASVKRKRAEAKQKLNRMRGEPFLRDMEAGGGGDGGCEQSSVCSQSTSRPPSQRSEFSLRILSPASGHNSSFSLQPEESGVSPWGKTSESEPVIVYTQKSEAKKGRHSRMRVLL
ncbi:unnamed protein product [Symbiodinium sp. CCMP2456]|nr:unnamed protein product [Symbiodinium sp. CCMP2456]